MSERSYVNLRHLRSACGSRSYWSCLQGREQEEVARFRGNHTEVDTSPSSLQWLCKWMRLVGDRCVPALISSADLAAGEPESISCKPGIGLYHERIDDRQPAHSSEKSQADCLPDGAKYLDAPDHRPISPLRVNDGAELRHRDPNGCDIRVGCGEVAETESPFAVEPLHECHLAGANGAGAVIQHGKRVEGHLRRAFVILESESVW